MFTDFLLKESVQLWLQDFMTENRDPYDSWLKTWDFVADDGIELFGRCLFVEDTMYATLVTINSADGL